MASTGKAEQVVFADVRCGLGEGPVWVAAERALYFVDIMNNRIYRKGGTLEAFDLPVQATCVLPAVSGRLLVASAGNLHFWTPGEALGPGLITPEFDPAAIRHNDCAVAPDGGVFVGEMDRNGATPNARLRHYRPNGMTETIMTGLTISNGIGFSPDSRHMYHVDSPPGIVYRRAFSGGDCGPEAIHIRYDPALGATPDGLCVDSDGNVWVCLWGGGRIDVWSPGGRKPRSIPMPAQNVTSCCFGGDDLETLFVTTAASDGYPESGKVFALRPGAKGLHQPLARDDCKLFWMPP